jgi:hypothetical protein
VSATADPIGHVRMAMLSLVFSVDLVET